jgi:hypothetical protein
MQDTTLLKAACEAAADATIDIMKVLNEKKSALQEGADVAVSLLNDQDFKDQVSKLIVGGFSNLAAEVKNLDLETSLAFAVSEIIPLVQKIVAAQKG